MFSHDWSRESVSLIENTDVSWRRCEDYAISLLEQCEDLREVETFLQTRNSGTKVRPVPYTVAKVGQYSEIYMGV
jgi:hypothetical protein